MIKTVVHSNDFFFLFLRWWLSGVIIFCEHLTVELDQILCTQAEQNG